MLDISDTEAVLVQMQQDLDNTQAWADKWQIPFVPNKYKNITISSKSESNYCPLTVSGINSAESHMINILVVAIDQKPNWISHINTGMTREDQRLGILW